MSLKTIATLSSLAIILLFPNLNMLAQCTDDTHATNQADSWVSCQQSTNPNAARGNSHWVMYDLGYTYTLGATTIWNYNVENETGKGFKNVTVDYSLNGTTWTEAGQFQLPQASGNNSYEGFNGFYFGDVEARYVLLTALDVWDGGTCAGISEFKIEVEDNPLPLELLNFSAKPKEDFISLNWESLDETNFSHFEVERSTDAVRFNFIEKVNGRNHTNINQYQLNDFNVRSGQRYYYRLKMVDLDGSYEYSPIRTAQLKNDLVFSLYPNPTNSILNISFEENTVKEIIIQNAAGHEVYRIEANQHIHHMDIATFPAGIYLCLVVDTNSTITSKRFVKVD